MKNLKKTINLLFAVVMMLGVFSCVPVKAEDISADLGVPKIKVKTLSNETGIKVSFNKAKDVEGYELYFTGMPENSAYGDKIKFFDYCGDIDRDDEFKFLVDNNGKRIFDYLFGSDGAAGQFVDKNGTLSFTCKYLQPGTYTVKVRSWKKGYIGWRYATIYSEWSKEKTFTLKETATNGFASSYDFSKVKKGDIVKFGAYEQDLNYTNGKEAIEWIVLNKTKKSVFLISKYAIDILPYHKNDEPVTWETCSLRKWLNNDFIKSAFNKTEQGMIKSTTLKNPGNKIFYMSEGGNDTEDKVFLLSQSDMTDTYQDFLDNYKFGRYGDYRCVYSWKTYKKGIKEGSQEDKVQPADWWLRTRGDSSTSACYVKDGIRSEREEIVNSYGLYVICDYIGIRPVVYLKLKS